MKFKKWDDKISTCFPKNQVQKEYEMANFWSTPKCYLVMSLPINSRITRRKSFWPILYSVCCVFWKFGHRKVCFQNYFLCYKMNILPLIRAVRETVSLTPPFPSRLHFPHTFSSWCEGNKLIWE